MEEIVSKSGKENVTSLTKASSSALSEKAIKGKQGRSGRSSGAPYVRDWKGPAIIGYAIIIFTFVVLGGWSAVAKLDSAVTAPGIVAEENSRKVVQHLEGGLIKEILVREGQHVSQGDLLFRLDGTQAQSGLELQQHQLDALRAQEARLVAERDRAKAITWPKELESRRNDPVTQQAIADETKQFGDRQASFRGQVDVLRSKIDQLNTEIQGLVIEREATSKQLQYVEQELKDLEYLLSQNLVQKSRVLALQREKSRLEGVIGHAVAAEAKAQNEIAEANLQIQQVRNKVDEEVARSILDVRQKISDTREKINVARNVFERLEIRAPVTGTVQDLKVFTLGGVVRPGEVLLEVVPDHDKLIIQAHVSPQDMDSMKPGMRAEVRFVTFKSSVLPIVLGHVASVSRDRLIEEGTKQPYFLAQVIVNDIPDQIRDHLVAGMPAALVFPTGERTVLNYLVRPLQDRMRGALRER